jgi:hypothetical protein
MVDGPGGCLEHAVVGPLALVGEPLAHQASDQGTLHDAAGAVGDRLAGRDDVEMRRRGARHGAVDLFEPIAAQPELAKLVLPAVGKHPP